MKNSSDEHGRESVKHLTVSCHASVKSDYGKDSS